MFLIGCCLFYHVLHLGNDFKVISKRIGNNDNIYFRGHDVKLLKDQ